MTGAAPSAAAPAAIDWPALRRIGIEGLVDLMRTEPDPARTESALVLCRNVDGLREVYAPQARPILAEAMGALKAYTAGLEKRAAVH